MGVTTHAQVNTVHWTRFRASALDDIDWTDHYQAHRAVMRLFSRTIEGKPDERRAANGILYRLDVLAGEAIILVQSTVAPQMMPIGGQNMVLPEKAWSLEPGARIAFRVAVNPIRRRTVRPDGMPPATIGQKRDRTGEKERVVGTVPVDHVSAWLTVKLADAVTDLEIVNHYRDQTESGSHKVVVDTLDCIATVANIETLDRLRRDGVGRAKAYGCGLLTTRPALD